MQGERPTLEQRNANLNVGIRTYVEQGYRVHFATETTAQLIRPKRFSVAWALIWFLGAGVGVLVYLIYYLLKNDEVVYLEVDESGMIRET